MRIALCNEVVRELPFEQQCALAAVLGYDGLEIAPFTLGEKAYELPTAERQRLRRVAQEHGIAISGLHWLLVSPKGLSITTSDQALRTRTIDIMRRLIDLCHDFGGTYLVHGSPEQRRTNGDRGAKQRAIDAFGQIADAASQADVVYCVEPLAPPEDDCINTVADAVAIVREINHPAVRTMIDACAAGRGEMEPFADLIERWLPSGHLKHFHFNDRNRRGPGQGGDRFGAALQVLGRSNYKGWIGIEPFEYVPDGPGAAAHAIGFLKGLREAAGS